ncbi:AraC-like DNA-binding protein [Haloactinopolyspora alba]|uniref:AraC-like DNA-binding protein n=1 Tax=Haloactinopolyspora alba TaxID=648780 RepID=A0A2P8E4Z5_9ACTN|nr:AraC family transcriptional regulator [Haloactinopolyspora alba]PSL04540.1 AraC-like DNA-binding protein [Haloactinopolyspora alba]
MYRERPSAVRHTVVWSARTAAREEAHRVLPDGCMDILWHDGRLLIAGPDTSGHVAYWTYDADYVGLRFGAGVGPRAVGVPAHAVRDQQVPLDHVWEPADVRRLEERLAAASRPGAELEAAVVGRLRRTDPPDPLVAALMHRLARDAAVGTLADDVGLSTRQLHRRCLDAVGYGPKTYARILRLGRALELCRSGSAAADTAITAGYADQAHFAREVRTLTGVTLTTLLT